jgi:tetratricopeptide (TPR) repeat protein
MSRFDRCLRTLALAALFAPAMAGAQALRTPPGGDNQTSEVSQGVGPATVSVRYQSPDVHGPDGADRRGKIWGEGNLVPYGYHEEAFGTCGKKCPWRGGANENTVFTSSHDLEIEGQRLSAGSYGLHFLTGADEWTVIFSKDSTSWGSFFYDEAKDALRVKVKPAKSEYHEWLTYEFTDRQTDHAKLELKWEDVSVPIALKVPNVNEIWYQSMDRELRNSIGFDYRSWQTAATFLLDSKIHTDTALAWADAAVNRQFVGRANFQTLSTLARAQEANGKAAEAKTTMDRALNDPSAGVLDLHQYGRQVLTRGDKAEALRIFQLNAKRFPKTWPVNVGLTRGYSAVGDYKNALKAANQALTEVPPGDTLNTNSLKAMIAKLEKGQDVN